ncbi:MAG: AMP-binding protein, partial [Bacteroidota bacterium]
MFTIHPRTLTAVLENSAALYSSRPAVSTIGGETISYAELHRQARTVSDFLHNHGIISGDRVAILSENKPQWGVAFFAITTMAAVAVPILPDFHQNEIRHIIRHAECKAIFVSRKYLQKLEDDPPPFLTTTIIIDDFSVYRGTSARNKLLDFLEEGEKEFSIVKEAALKFLGKIPEAVQPDSLASIVYTSGTTGHSKGVMLTHGNLVSDVIGTTHIVDIGKTDRLLSILPLAHTYECTLGLITPLAVGASISYLDKLPTASALIPAMQQVKPTIMLSVPLVIEKIYKTRIYPQLHGSFLTRSVQHFPFLRKNIHRIAGRKLMKSFGGELKLFCIGGAPLASDVESFLREARFPYALGYGLTETSPLIAGTNQLKTKFRSTGAALPEASLRILRPDPSTGEGEIIVKGPMVMKGYYKDDERTRLSFTDDGWFKTGDLGVFTPDGYLYIKGRLKNMILGPNGKNIYPEEIESVINEFDIVLESVVYEKQHQIVARVFLDYEKIDAMMENVHAAESKVREKISIVLKDLQTKINERLASFSRIAQIVEQSEPFEKT